MASGALSAGLTAVSTVFGMFGMVGEKERQREAAEKAVAYERMRFGLYEEDAQRKQTRDEAQNRVAYAASGVDFRTGSPMSVMADLGIEYARAVERERTMSQLNILQIKAGAAAAERSANFQIASMAIGGAGTLLGNVMKRKAAEID